MPTIPLGLGDWESISENVSRSKLRNMYLIPNPVSLDKVSRVSRPTLTPLTTMGPGPIVKMWTQPNLLNGDTLLVSGTQLYRTDFSTLAFVADLPGTEIPEFAGRQNTDGTSTICIVRDGVLYRTSGSGLSAISIPDFQQAQSVATIDQFFIVTVKDSQKFYWIKPGEIVIDDLDFASAERLPDPIMSVSVVGDEIWFLGLTGPEIWQDTGDLDAPFQRIPGRIYLEGCHSRDTVVTTSIDGLPALLWVTENKAVVKTQGSPSKISNESVEELLRTEDDLSCWSFRFNRHDFYLINSPSFTLVYDLTTEVWCRWDSYLKSYWKAQTGVQRRGVTYTADVNSNQVFTLGEGVSDGTEPVIREVSGFVQGEPRPFPVSSVIVYLNSGWSPSYTSTPSVELRWSDDRGNTWSDWLSSNTGNRGEYDTEISFRSLGLIRSVGRVFELRMSDNARYRLDYCTFNEKT